jgi:hypothetical protein
MAKTVEQLIRCAYINLFQVPHSLFCPEKSLEQLRTALDAIDAGKGLNDFVREAQDDC